MRIVPALLLCLALATGGTAEPIRTQVIVSEKLGLSKIEWPAPGTRYGPELEDWLRGHDLRAEWFLPGVLIIADEDDPRGYRIDREALERFPPGSGDEELIGDLGVAGMGVAEFLALLADRRFLDLDLIIAAPSASVDVPVNLRMDGITTREAFQLVLQLNRLKLHWFSERCAFVLDEDDQRVFGLDVRGAPQFPEVVVEDRFRSTLSLSSITVRDLLGLLARPVFLDLDLEFDEGLPSLDHPVQIEMNHSSAAELFVLALQLNGLQAVPREGGGYRIVEESPASEKGSWLR